MSLLTEIKIIIPSKDSAFYIDLGSVLGSICKVEGSKITLPVSKAEYLPITTIYEEDVEIPSVHFLSGEHIISSIELKNITQEEWSSKHDYCYISLESIKSRLGSSFIKGIDHTGINLPWFKESLHPEILKLREELKVKCLYHLFPSGENWDFIIPGTSEEVEGNVVPDYTKIRRPKFEIVSFPKSSTPLIQIEVYLSKKYEDFAEMFLEGISIPDVRCVWLYLENPYDIDVCLVLNEEEPNDWADYFKDSRYR